MPNEKKHRWLGSRKVKNNWNLWACITVSLASMRRLLWQQSYSNNSRIRQTDLFQLFAQWNWLHRLEIEDSLNQRPVSGFAWKTCGCKQRRIFFSLRRFDLCRIENNWGSTLGYKNIGNIILSRRTSNWRNKPISIAHFSAPEKKCRKTSHTHTPNNTYSIFAFGNENWIVFSNCHLLLTFIIVYVWPVVLIMWAKIDFIFSFGFYWMSQMCANVVVS